MTRTEELEGLVAASKLLSEKSYELAREPFPIYAFVAHAKNAVDARINAMLRDGTGK